MELEKLNTPMEVFIKVILLMIMNKENNDLFIKNNIVFKILINLNNHCYFEEFLLLSIFFSFLSIKSASSSYNITVLLFKHKCTYISLVDIFLTSLLMESGLDLIM
jgi:hypothetical protein